MKRTRILLADDHSLVLDAFKHLLEPTYEVVGIATDGYGLIAAAERWRPDVVLVDVGMPRLNGLDACEQLRAKLPGTRVIFLTQNQDPEVAAEAIRRGASGYLLKTAPAAELFTAIQQALHGKFHISETITQGSTLLFITQARNAPSKTTLTLRQREVLQLLAEGKSMKETADILAITPRTVAFHKYGMMEQLGFKTGTDLIHYAMQLGLTTQAQRGAA